MSVITKPSKSSGPQDLAKNAELPAADWGVEKLREFAAQRSAMIDKVVNSLSQDYWRLGAALHYLRQKLHLRHGEWEQFLSSNKISTTRAAKARAIHETFPSLDKVVGLSVDEAYGRREAKQPREAKPSKRTAKEKAPSTMNTPKTFRGTLQDVVDQAEMFQPERLRRFPEQTRELLDAVVAAIKKLEALRQRLSLPAKSSST